MCDVICMCHERVTTFFPSQLFNLKEENVYGTLDIGEH